MPRLPRHVRLQFDECRDALGRCWRRSGCSCPTRSRSRSCSAATAARRATRSSTTLADEVRGAARREVARDVGEHAAGSGRQGVVVGGMTRRLPPPLAPLLAELTHRCPLQCPYCSNPLELERAARRARHRRRGAACSTRPPRSACCRSISPAASRRRGATSRSSSPHAAGARPLHQPDHRRRAARRSSGCGALVAAGLDHVQLSFQDARGRKRRPHRRLSRRRMRKKLAVAARSCAPPGCR